MKLKKPHCNFCNRDLPMVRVDGSETGEQELSTITFDVTIDNKGAHAKPDSFSVETFLHTTNPIRFTALVESWVEEIAEEVRCPLCTKTVKLTRIVPKPLTPTAAQLSGPSPMQQLVNQLAQATSPQAPFAMPTTSSSYAVNQGVIVSMLDSKFSDQELIDLLTDIDCLPPASTKGYGRSDLMSALIDVLYN